MAVTAKLYGSALVKALNKEIDFDTDTIKAMLCTSAYSPAADTHDYKNDITNEVTGTGYTAGGATLANKSIAYIAANSWTIAWQASTAYAVGDLVRPSTGNGHLYRCTVAGTSGASAPTWPTVSGADVVDSGATWTEVGSGAVKLDADDVSWANSTITARYAVIYDDSPATDATKPLIGYIDFGADVISSAGAFTITFHSAGIFVFVIN